ncbi:MAG: glycosyl hydrolase [Chloroflexota bacterium]
MTGEEDDVTSEGLRSYEQLVGKSATWVYFSHNWFRGRSFPMQTASWVRDAGSVPYIRLMLRSDAIQGHAEPTFTLSRILKGEFDADLRAWARAAREFGSPLIVEYGTEVNGEWFPWNGIWNGAGTLDGYGDPSSPDGPERFRGAYRRIIGICREEGADNITWVFHVNNQDVPEEPWNRLEGYYPGDDWIDWLGVSVYGAGTPMDSEWPQFRELMDQVYPRLAALSPSKPIILAEFGVTAGNPLGDQAAWAESALTDLTALRWPRVIGFSWWNEAWQNDDNPAHNTNMRLQDNPALADVFQRLVGAKNNVLGKPVLTPL